MNKIFLEDLMDQLVLEVPGAPALNHGEQDYVKDRVQEDYNYEQFPMVCFEETGDSNFTMDIDHSRFLNNKDYDLDWFVGTDYDANPVYLLCLKTAGNCISVEAFEVNKSMRHQGIGANVISIVESIASTYYDFISVSPFDTNAINFWEHMEYVEGKNGQWIKKL